MPRRIRKSPRRSRGSHLNWEVTAPIVRQFTYDASAQAHDHVSADYFTSANSGRPVRPTSTTFQASSASVGTLYVEAFSASGQRVFRQSFVIGQSVRTVTCRVPRGVDFDEVEGDSTHNCWKFTISGSVWLQGHVRFSEQVAQDTPKPSSPPRASSVLP